MSDGRTIVKIDPADMSWKGQPQRVVLVRPAEVWQFSAFLFAAVLTLSYALMDDLWAPREWKWKVGVRVGLFVIFGYSLIFNRRVRAHLVGLQNRIKREEEEV